MNFIFSLLWSWVRDSQFHKTAASAAAGTSIGMMTVLGMLEQKIETVRADVKNEVIQVRAHVEQIDSFVKHRKEITDERFQNIDKGLVYLKGAIDVTNQNILHLSSELKRRN